VKKSEIVQRILFDYDELSREEIITLCAVLPSKMIRWLGIQHPDNRTRKIFYELTNVKIGEGTVINIHFVVSDGYQPLLKIGERVAISPNVTVICESAPNNSRLQEIEYVKQDLMVDEPVVIEDDVWIGTNAVILPGVTIGRGSIVGAGAVVTGDVPPEVIVAGVPARVIRSLNSE
jgi:acetyltransferase-like isoleucine patch superfamily enzyme